MSLLGAPDQDVYKRQAQPPSATFWRWNIPQGVTCVLVAASWCSYAAVVIVVIATAKTVHRHSGHAAYARRANATKAADVVATPMLGDSSAGGQNTKK